jgi:enterochelin esterase-like enzyme
VRTDSSLLNTSPAPVAERLHLPSGSLRRDVVVSVIRPENISPDQSLSLVLFQDGQDFPALQMLDTIVRLTNEGQLPPILIAGIHANENRIHEYGVAAQPDYKGRGNLAGEHTRFVIEELLPHLHANYPIRAGRHAIAGFSLGGLMALDIAWNYPNYFSHVGVFSGSLWWREKPFNEDYLDAHRIMHQQIKRATHRPGLKFWFQTGTNDETCDRNHDGVIDSIEDTLDCIAELERKGYRWQSDVTYREILGGEHHARTWRAVLPEFLRWAFDKPR